MGASGASCECAELSQESPNYMQWTHKPHSDPEFRLTLTDLRLTPDPVFRVVGGGAAG